MAEPAKDLKAWDRLWRDCRAPDCGVRILTSTKEPLCYEHMWAELDALRWENERRDRAWLAAEKFDRQFENSPRGHYPKGGPR